jgi:predicted Co/Zn/Cd cation transporter (cation efflux family)
VLTLLDNIIIIAFHHPLYFKKLKKRIMVCYVDPETFHSLATLMISKFPSGIISLCLKNLLGNVFRVGLLAMESLSFHSPENVLVSTHS